MERVEYGTDGYPYKLSMSTGIENTEQYPVVEVTKADYENRLKADMVAMLDKIRAEILDCLKALDGIEKSGFNIYLPNELSGRRLTFHQCLEIIDKYKAEMEVEDGKDN